MEQKKFKLIWFVEEELSFGCAGDYIMKTQIREEEWTYEKLKKEMDNWYEGHDVSFYDDVGWDKKMRIIDNGKKYHYEEWFEKENL